MVPSTLKKQLNQLFSGINKLIYMPLYPGGWIDRIPDSQSFPNKINSKPDREGAICTRTNTARHKGPQQVAASVSSTPALSWRPHKSQEPELSSLEAWWIYSCTVAHWIYMVKCGKWAFFYLKMETVTTKGLTSHPHLSPSGLSYLLRDFFSGPLCRQDTFRPNMHKQQEKKARGGSLHHYLSNECRPPHSTWVNAWD